MIPPMTGSLLAEMAATSLILRAPTLRERFSREPTTSFAMRCTCRMTSVPFTSGVMSDIPRTAMASVSTMAVVVPSPALVAVLSAASFIIRTARFSTGSIRSMLLATVTPSLVTVIPWVWYWLSISTVLPRGPRVLFTALAMVAMPLPNLRRASSSNVRLFGV